MNGELWITLGINHKTKTFTIAAVNPDREESYAKAKERLPVNTKFFCFNIITEQIEIVTENLDKWLKKQGFTKKRERRGYIRMIGETLAEVFEVDLNTP